LSGQIILAVYLFLLERRLMSEFAALFQPGTIGTMRLENRIIMAAMGNRLGDENGHVTDRTIDYYRARARGGVGLIITQLAAVSVDTTLPGNFSVYDDSCIPGLSRLAEAMHEDGVKIIVQLVNFGPLNLFNQVIPEGTPIKVPSIMPWMPADRLYEEASEEDIDRYVDDFSEAARRVKEAGIDGVELHGCHGCLASAFMSPVLNRRTDRYGGSVENRIRFAREIVEGMKGKAGADFPVSVRFNFTDDVAGGVTLEEALRQAAILESAGADAISVAAGIEYWATLESACYSYAEGPLLPITDQVKKVVGVPVITASKIGPELAERLVKDGRADFIAMARPLLADPELPNKLRQGRLEDIRSCVYCNNCLKTGSVGCSVNPFLYRESKVPPRPAESPKRVMVIGGGPAGMQAAAILGQRGHRVSLYEKGRELGGQWKIAAAMPEKEGFTSLTEYLRRSLDKYGVEVSLGTEVTKEKALEVRPDAVIVATGAVPQDLNVPGATGRNVVQANDVIEGKAEVKDRVVVLGGRFLGMEMAIWMAEQGKEVSLVTRGNLGGKRGPEEGLTYRTLVRRLIELRVPLYLHTPVLEIMEGSVIVDLSDEVFSLPADTVIVAVGAESDNKLARELEGVVPEIHLIGDCVEPRDAAHAAKDAAKVATRL